MKVKKISLRCTLGETAATVYGVQGLPEGTSCYWSPEDVRKPSGEAYVVKKKGGRKTIRRFKTAAQAEAHAMEWAEAAARPAKRKAAKR